MTNETETQQPEQKAECMERYRHAFYWVWVGDKDGAGRKWSDTVRCSNCGMEKVQTYKKVLL